MLSPKARKALTLTSAILIASLLSAVTLTYFLFLSPAAKNRRLEGAADNKFSIAREIVSDLSIAAEYEKRLSSLKRATKHQRSDGFKALASITDAQKDYNKLLKRKLSGQNRIRIEKKIEASKHLIKSANNYVRWIKEAKTGVNTIKYTSEAFDWQAKGLDKLSKAITALNNGQNAEALQAQKEISKAFSKAQKAISRAQSHYRNQDIGKLKLIADLYKESSKGFQMMAEADKKDTDTYNKGVEILNKNTQQAAKLAKSNPITQDLNSWLENNFYYDGGQLIFHYKKAVETWPRD